MSPSPNGISIGSAVFAGHIRVSNTHTRTHTDRHANIQTDHATCDICRNRPHRFFSNFFLGCLIHCHAQFVACTFVTCCNKDKSINHLCCACDAAKSIIDYPFLLVLSIDLYTLLSSEASERWS